MISSISYTSFIPAGLAISSAQAAPAAPDFTDATDFTDTTDAPYAQDTLDALAFHLMVAEAVTPLETSAFFSFDS